MATVVKKRAGASTAPRKLSLQEKLDALKKSGALDSGSGSDAFWKPPEGVSYVRICPPVGDMDYFFVQVGRHFIGKVPHECPFVTYERGDECPICEAVRAMFRGTKADRVAAKELAVRKQWWMNVIVRSGNAPGGAFNGPLIWTPGVLVFTQIYNIASDPDCADDLFTCGSGIDLRVTREGRGRLDTTYTIGITRRQVPFIEGKGETAAQKWLEDKAQDLSTSVEVPTYDELVELLEEMDTASDDVDDKPSRKPAPHTGKPTFRRK